MKGSRFSDLAAMLRIVLCSMYYYYYYYTVHYTTVGEMTIIDPVALCCNDQLKFKMAKIPILFTDL